MPIYRIRSDFTDITRLIIINGINAGCHHCSCPLVSGFIAKQSNNAIMRSLYNVNTLWLVGPRIQHMSSQSVGVIVASSRNNPPK